MKLQSNNILENLTKDETKTLTTEVKEMLASGCKKQKNRIFSTADFWNIQRQRKNSYSKRFAF